jgi:hypothetical protein
VTDLDAHESIHAIPEGWIRNRRSARDHLEGLFFGLRAEVHEAMFPQNYELLGSGRQVVNLPQPILKPDALTLLGFGDGIANGLPGLPQNVHPSPSLVLAALTVYAARSPDWTPSGTTPTRAGTSVKAPDDIGSDARGRGPEGRTIT